jgi:chromosomal replication initiator protein
MDLLTTTSTQPERAWQMVLGQLQMEMSKASFDTWVKSIEFISLIDDRFTLGTYNAYGRDWLDSRLKTTVQRLLQGILGRPIAVQFIVLDEVDDQDNDEEEEEQNDHEGEKEEFHLQVLHETVRGVLIEPERVVKLPV